MGGLSIDYGAWRSARLPEPLTICLAPLAIGLAGAMWVSSCSFVASRTRVDLVGFMRRAALAYASLAAYPAIAFSHPRLAFVGVDVSLVCYLTATAVAFAWYRPDFRTTLFTFALSRVVVIIVAEATAALVGYRGTHEPAGRDLTEAWARWDGAHYLSIARSGYFGSNFAFFPLYPLSIRLLGSIAGGPFIAALIISNVALLVALTMLRRLVEEMYDAATGARAIFYVATFPTAVFFSAIYTESLFLALSVATFVSLRKGRWLAAGFAGGLAAMTRFEGVLLIVPYLVEAFTKHRAERERHSGRGHAAFYGASMIALGFTTFMVLSKLLSGDALYFLHVQSHWQRRLSWPWTSFVRSARLLVGSHDPATVAVQTTELTFFAFALALTVIGLRRIPMSFSAYTLVSLVVPLCSGSLMSGQRFVLVLFPLFVILAIAGARPAVDSAIRTISLTLLGAFTVFFAAGFWVG